MSNIVIRLGRIGASSLEKNVCTTGMITNIFRDIIDCAKISQILQPTNA